MRNPCPWPLCVVGLFAFAACASTDPRSIANAAWEPVRPPLTIDELRERGLNESFASFMRKWKGFVAD